MNSSGSKRKGGNRAIPSEVRQLIQIIYTENPEKTARSIRTEAKSILAKFGQLSFLPSERTIARIISLLTIPPPKEIDGPWSIAASVEYSIPPDANRDLLTIWRWCTVIGRPFTIREAQWVARLRGLTSFEKLLYTAFLYSKREHDSEVLKEPFVTSDLDSDLIFASNRLSETEWFHHTASLMGVIPSHPTRLIQFLSEDDEFQIRLDSIFSKNLSNSLMYKNLAGLAVARYYMPLTFKIEDYKLTGNGDRLFALWLRRLSEGPRWEKLELEQKQKIGTTLYEEIVEAVKNREHWAAKTVNELDENERNAIEDLVAKGEFIWKPSKELLEEVGLELSGQISKRRK